VAFVVYLVKLGESGWGFICKEKKALGDGILADASLRFTAAFTPSTAFLALYIRGIDK
jgi:hypothetical protein